MTYANLDFSVRYIFTVLCGSWSAVLILQSSVYSGQFVYAVLESDPRIL